MRMARRSAAPTGSLGRATLLVVVVSAFLLEGYVVKVGLTEGALPAPPWFGNGPTTVARLPRPPAGESYRFVVVDDTQSPGTFEELMERLRQVRPAFAVLLGDTVPEPTEVGHAFFRSELQEVDSPCPVFFVPGNHDVDPQKFPLSRFERFYGPSRMSFEVGPDLFLLFPLYTDNEDGGRQAAEATAWLRGRLEGRRQRYRNVFLFFHSPVGIHPGWERPGWEAYGGLAELIRRYRVTACFSGHVHRYGQVEAGGTDYFISGGGGASLKERGGVPGFHHALVLEVKDRTVGCSILPLEKRRDLEDKLEYWAIVRAWPYMKREYGDVLFWNLVAGAVVFAGVGFQRGGRRWMDALRLRREERYGCL